MIEESNETKRFYYLNSLTDDEIHNMLIKAKKEHEIYDVIAYLTRKRLSHLFFKLTNPKIRIFLCP